MHSESADATTPPLWPPSAGSPAAKPVQAWAGLSPDALGERLAGTDLPAVITDFVAELPGLADWTPEALRPFASAPVKWLEDPLDRSGSMIDIGARRKRVHATLGEFLDAIAGPTPTPTYLIKLLASQIAPELDAALAPLRACLPASADDQGVTGPFFWMGQGGVTSPLHFEPEANLLVQLCGAKDWILFPPDAAADLYAPCAEHPEAFRHWSPVDLAAPDRARHPRFFGLAPHRLVLHPGQALYVPAGWWHGVRYPGLSASANIFWQPSFETASAGAPR